MKRCGRRCRSCGCCSCCCCCRRCQWRCTRCHISYEHFVAIIIMMTPLARHSSVYSSAPAILSYGVQIPRTSSLLFNLKSIFVVYLSLYCGKDDNKEKRPRLAYVNIIIPKQFQYKNCQLRRDSNSDRRSIVSKR